MRWFDEFRAFIRRGNVIDLAVAVIIGAAFNKIVTSLVGDVLMPVIGMATQGVDLAKLSYDFQNPISEEIVKVKYGAFVQAGIDFLIIAFCVFWLVKLVYAIHASKPEEPKPVELTTQEKLLTEIRDLLKAKEPQVSGDKQGIKAELTPP